MTLTRVSLLALLLLCGGLSAQEETPWLGIKLEVIDKTERDKLKIDSGLRVTEVTKGSPADTAGIEKGDIILSAGEKTVNSIEDMRDVMAKLRPGDTLGLGVRHENGKVEPFMVKIGRKGQSTEEFKDDVRSKELRDAIEKKRKELRDLEDELAKRLEDLRSGKATPERRTTPKPEDPKPETPTQPEPKVESRDPAPTEVKVKIGASFEDLAVAEAKKLGIETGLLTVRVNANSAAAKAGMKEGDVLYEVGGEKVTGTGHFRTLLAKYKAGDKVEFKVMRNGKKESLTVTLEAR